MTTPDLFMPAPVADDAQARTIYPGCGRDALQLYQNPTQERARRKRRGRPVPLRMSRAAMLVEALLLLDCEVMLWPRDVLGYLEHNAQWLAGLYAANDEATP